MKENPDMGMPIGFNWQVYDFEEEVKFLEIKMEAPKPDGNADPENDGGDDGNAEDSP